ncbi:hypothetical protein BU25DRAFT_177202 [Macroventuria anomochaeta]|uniref:Uncharacterized protein n=1 Tax=Macroventuria anomochaeta TaxID=301207 RepID=A0ACB6RQN9_9PLEO|nr:uncharacterized protein BU25DRAFT_177202 [Macroventuria anomochaeta]KAF2623592.1 hypothetical protein BU25DRAFT_177202 [Macroventuria anomochaeta]
MQSVGTTKGRIAAISGSSLYLNSISIAICMQKLHLHGVRRSRPITLQVTSSSPTLGSTHAPGLQLLGSVFEPLIKIFFAVWNGSSKSCSKEWLVELERDVRTALPPVLEVSNEEIASLRVSQFWLRIKLWELFPRFSFLSTESVYDCTVCRQVST